MDVIKIVHRQSNLLQRIDRIRLRAARRKLLHGRQNFYRLLDAARCQNNLVTFDHQLQ